MRLKGTLSILAAVLLVTGGAAQARVGTAQVRAGAAQARAGTAQAQFAAARAQIAAARAQIGAAQAQIGAAQAQFGAAQAQFGAAQAQFGAAHVQPPRAAAVLPASVRVVDATVSFPAIPRYAHRAPIRGMLTSRSRVARLVSMVDALPVASRHVVCPAIVVLGPELTLRFKAARSGPTLAEAEVAVTTGTKGHSGSSPCFPIRLTVGNRPQIPRVSATFVRAVGRMIGASIS